MVAGNTLDRVLFQRAINFVGHKDMSDYTVQAEVMTDGDRRIKSNIGLINQRYIFALIGNSQKPKLFQIMIDLGILCHFLLKQNLVQFKNKS